MSRRRISPSSFGAVVVVLALLVVLVLVPVIADLLPPQTTRY
jgi:hypothetical protein